MVKYNIVGEKKVLINFSNHPYEKWSEKQKEAAKVYGDTKDLPFPSVPGSASENEIEQLAEETIERIVSILEKDPSGTVLAQGEFTLTYAVVSLLKQRGIRVISACADRKVTEVTGDDGKMKKQVEFCFERFREYR